MNCGDCKLIRLQIEQHRRLIRDVLRLWVATKMLNLPASICGDAKFGTRVQDPTSPFCGIVPAAPVMCAQLEIIVSSQVQHPCRESVMKKLEKMFQKSDLRHWFTIYLTLFILLHIGSLTASREAERAKMLNETVRILRQRQEPNVNFTLNDPSETFRQPRTYHNKPQKPESNDFLLSSLQGQHPTLEVGRGPNPGLQVDKSRVDA